MSAPVFIVISPSPRGEWYEDHKGNLHFRADLILRCAWADAPALSAWLYSIEGCSYPYPEGSPYAIVRHVKSEGVGRTGG
jgi:hypothetical protein